MKFKAISPYLIGTFFLFSLVNNVFATEKSSKKRVTRQDVTVVAIDAGHGGKDPGAIGRNLGIKEKDITLSISRELKSLLDADPHFKGVLTRSSDHFVQLPDRSEIARRNKANYLISIHADSSPSSNSLRGASVWVLSNQRASDEMGKWLEDHEKQSELLGGAGSVLAGRNERYLNQTVLDLQFSHSQRVGYELGKTVLSRLTNVMNLAKSQPQHASLSVLRSPDIPSILVETGFLSNAEEEAKLASPAYRRQVARAIYNGLLAYRAKNLGSIATSSVHKAVIEETKPSSKEEKKDELKQDKSAKKSAEQKSDKPAESDKKSKSSKSDKDKNSEKSSSKTSDTKEKSKVKEEKNEKSSSSDEQKSSKKESSDKPKVKSTNGTHVVQENETVYSIARMYDTTPEKISQLNNLKNNKIIVGKKLKVK